MHIFSFDGMSVYSIDQYQNAIPRVMPLHEFKQVQLQERFMLMAHDSIGHLKILCMSALSLSGGTVCEWKHCSSPLCVEKTLGLQVHSHFPHQWTMHSLL